MIGIDTNILVRVLVDDKKAPEQCQKARVLLTQHKKIFISTVVLVETIWVLQRAYDVNKDQLLFLLNKLLLQNTLFFENKSLLARAVEIFSQESFGFSDSLILATHEKKQCLLYTFDKKLSAHAQASNLNHIKN